MIKAKHPVRVAFAGCSSGPCYRTKSLAINAFDGALLDYDLCLDRDDLVDFIGNFGRKIINVLDEYQHVVGRAVITWYRMPSGRWEFVGYLA